MRRIPHTTAYTGAFQDSKQIYIVMEHCKGGDLLEQLLKEGRAMPEKRVVREVVLPSLTALAHLHAAGIIHRCACTHLTRPAHAGGSDTYSSRRQEQLHADPAHKRSCVISVADYACAGRVHCADCVLLQAPSHCSETCTCGEWIDKQELNLSSARSSRCLWHPKHHRRQ